MTKLPNLTEFTVQRSEWLTPDKAEKFNITSGLCDRKTGLKCCLGFMLEQCGLPTITMAGQGWPGNIPDIQQEQLLEEPSDDCSVQMDTDMSSSAADINDDEMITNEDREKQLIELFGKHGIKLNFIN